MGSPRAVIIGAGIGGLTTAIALRRIGWNVSVHERAERIADVGAGITLWANATRVLSELGIGDDVIPVGRRFPSGSIRTAEGATLAVNRPGRIDAQAGSATVAVHRAELHSALLGALPPDAVTLGRTCTSADTKSDRPVVTFADGTTDEADLIIGADGIHSAVRRLIRPESTLRYSGYAAFRGVAEASWDETSESWGCGRRFGIVPLTRNRVYWFATENAPEGAEIRREEWRSHLLDRFGSWHDPIPALLRATPADAILRNDIHDIVPFSGWSRGRVVLLGDAVHPTTPNLGQGACMAIESAAVLAEELQRKERIEDALTAYEIRRRSRTAMITRESWRIGRIGQIENRVGCAIRDLAMRLVPDAVAERRIATIVAARP